MRAPIFLTAAVLFWAPFAWGSLDFCGAQLSSNLLLPDLYARQLVNPAERRSTQDLAFRTDRSLQAYVTSLHRGFGRTLLSLSSSQVYIDVGAGDANALADYLSEPSFRIRVPVRNGLFDLGIEEKLLPPRRLRAQAIGISYEATAGAQDKVELLKNGRLKYVVMSLHDYAKANPASADAVSDEHAATIYALFDHAAVDIVGLLKSAAKGYFNGGNVRILDGQGKEVPVLTYLKQGTGFSVSNNVDRAFAYDVFQEDQFEVTRTKGPISLPALIVESVTAEDNGPFTIYRLNPSARTIFNR
jgi:hypothetical protein